MTSLSTRVTSRRPHGSAQDGESKRHGNHDGNAVEPPERSARGGQGDDFAIDRHPAESELHPEHVCERDREHEEMGQERRGEPPQLVQGDGAGEDHFVELEQLRDHEQLEDGEQPHAEGQRQFPGDHAVEQSRTHAATVASGWRRSRKQPARSF